MTSSGALTFYHGNNQGSIIAVSDDGGVADDTNTYGPFGESDLSGTTFGFTGQRYDIETGLYYYKNRYYNPTLGRFMQPDPIPLLSNPAVDSLGVLNEYLYVNNSPTNYLDPYGLLPENTGNLPVGVGVEPGRPYDKTKPPPPDDDVATQTSAGGAGQIQHYIYPPAKVSTGTGCKISTPGATSIDPPPPPRRDKAVAAPPAKTIDWSKEPGFGKDGNKSVNGIALPRAGAQ